MSYVSKANRIINHAHGRICDAEALLMHSFTDEDKASAGDALFAAQRYLRRAVAARDAWNAVEHDEYEVYPDVPENDPELAV